MTSASAAESGKEPVTVLRAALASALAGLAAVDEHAPSVEADVKRVLNEVVDALLPIRGALFAAREADPGGLLANALGFLHNAVQHVEAGDPAAARAAVITAHVALTRLDHLGSDDGSHDVAPGDWRL